MKFTDGNWMHQKGVTPHYAAECHIVKEDGVGLTLLVPCHAIRHRGDTLAGPMLTLKLRAPRPGIISVKITHFEGVKDHGPHFETYEDPADFDWQVTDEEVRFRSGSLTAIIRRNPWSFSFESGGKTLTTSPNRGSAWMEVEGQGSFAMGQLGLSVGEQVYGLGERFTPFIKNGQSVEIWNEDGGTNSDQAYKNVPFYLTSRGYGVFVNNSGRVSFEVGTERTNLVQFSVPGETIEYAVIDGPTPKDVLARYTAYTGRPALPPAWSFGLWLSTSFTTNYDEATVNEFIQGMADRDIPLSVFHYDCFWMRGLHWCDFEWDPAVFPDPQGMLARLHDRDLKVCVWINPYIAQASHLFAEAAEAGYLVKKANGDVWQWDLWQPGMGIVDFTNPAAKAWFQKKLADLIDMGVDALKTDFGERIPTDVVWHDGSDPGRMHNYYSQIYNEAVFEVLEAKRGKGEAVLFARSGTAGGQKLPVHWGGDCWSTFEAMAESLRGGLSLSLCGFGFWSHDIGGFEGKPPLEIYSRWVAFGLLSSHSRLHGSTSYRVPWVYGDEAVDVLRYFTKLKLSLMPYLWAKAFEAHEQGIPMMRAMHLEFPNDPACETLDRQYMLGDSLLVAPVFTPEGEVTFYVPEGRWTSVIDGKVYEGPKWFTETHGLQSLPLLARPNSIIAFGQDDRPDYDTRNPSQLRWFEPGDKAESVLRGPAGEVRRMRGYRGEGQPFVELEQEAL
jgi:alpha-D-xyloside xylohydrolase